ncbi:probable ABC transporter, ATP-binding protein [Stappia aggregata IAM 12614]|uniref:Probable ABC transporter, ATP-binding protein n=1 Tax=Roseibium aggregatum (strain ATCC 25650 / DSM 13394 / JCM 20685 / NBRC 16684 / NCIMB 2208 / IAM 12614 / B1) TaxID=384765 RepID=A0P0Z8_ROSAI|nr:ABC transporter ATP-binding protein [Roseibium aggregatum]EAV41183.1 probable ABC transporter, ATP-binding protein [Stappia aggregata IAM 12614] [Roseibium aggregatum IAM 12614]
MKFSTKSFEGIPPVLSIENLTVGLTGNPGAKPVLNGISFKIRAGETLCLVGESGSGKSVTSLAAMGLLPKSALEVTGGKILLQDRNLLDLNGRQMRDMRARHLSMVFQEPMTALNPVMRVGQQIEEVLNTHVKISAKEKKQRVLDIMEQVHLPDVDRIYRSYPHQLSGGQRQRIMIAMALILEPQLLIADEPTTALDVTTQRQILSLIAELQAKHGTAVLFITHDMGVVAEIADTVQVMKHGELVEQAPVETLLRNPQMDYTRKLLQAVPSLTPRPARETAPVASALTVQGLRKVYGSSGWLVNREPTNAARDVSFEIPRGRTLGIVGESGSGKSTVARCIMRLIDPTEGSVKVGDLEIATLGRAALRPHRRHIQIVFQDPFRSLNPRWTVGRSLVEGPLNCGEDKGAAMTRARELLALVGLPPDAIDRYPHQFSGGQRQRIAIARAVAMEPDVLVADEAVSALDVSVQDQVLKLLDELQQKLGIAILFITHDLRVAAQICDDVLVMQKGRVVEHDTAANVLGNPKHPYTKALIEAAPGRDWDFANFRELNAASA